jgi:transcriptional regulator with XRE-family HTH domain
MSREKAKNDLRRTISERVRGLLEEYEITAYRLAKTLKLAPSTMSQIKTRRNLPQLDVLVLLANYFGVSVGYLLGLEER